MAIQLITSDKTIEAWKPEKPLARLSDGGGLFLLASRVSGRRHAWRLDYTFEMKRQTISLGVYPKVTLALARKKALKLQQLVAEGINPSVDCQEKKTAILARREEERRALTGEAPKNSFEDVARRWYETRKSDWMDSHGNRVIRRLEIHVFPQIGRKPIASIEPPDVLEACRRIQGKGTIETAHRALEHASNVFCFGVGEGLLKADPCRDLKNLLQKHHPTHFAAITDPRELADLIRATRTYQGTAVVHAALQLMPMLFLRPGELRNARWDNFDLHNGQWLVPSECMKRTKQGKIDGDEHYVPLARQAVRILEGLWPLTGGRGLVFPGNGASGGPISDGTINKALRRMGYSADAVTGHGFRATARTLLHERLCIDKDIIELQLAHEVSDANGRAYNRTEFVLQRQEMMQVWADYLDDLHDGRDDYRRNAALPTFTPVTSRLAKNEGAT